MHLRVLRDLIALSGDGAVLMTDGHFFQQSGGTAIGDRNPLTRRLHAQARCADSAAWSAATIILRTEFDEEYRRRARSGDAPDEKGKPMVFRLKAHVGADADSGLVHTLTTTPANVADATVENELLHGRESVVYGYAGYILRSLRRSAEDARHVP
jgi:hypothetical protein